MPLPAVERSGEPSGMPRWQRLLLSGSVLETSAGRRTARDWAVDVAMFSLAAAFGLYILLSTWDEHAPWSAVLDVVLGAVACAALWVRRRWPVAVGLLVMAVSAVSGLANGAALPALFNAAIRAPFRWLGAIVLLAVAPTAIYPALFPTGPDGRGYLWQMAFGLALNAIALGWGLFVRAQRELVWALRDRAIRAEADQQRRAHETREAERRRIAGEMHDVLAHRLSLLSVHAGALERWGGQVPQPLVETAGVIRSNARAALGELRDVIGVLRGPEGDAVAPPQPTLDNIPALVDESRATGLRITSAFRVPDDADVPAAVGRTAYRAVQEGLTNARKHGGGGRVDLRIEAAARDRTLVVELVTARPLRPAPLIDEARLGTGTGLLGLAERVELAGGRLAYGPDADGNFVLRAALSWSAA
jgi:signal transduction histidine kinase